MSGAGSRDGLGENGSAGAAAQELPDRAVLTDEGRTVLDAAVAFRHETAAHHAGPPDPSGQLAVALIEAAKHLVAVWPGLEAVVLEEVGSLMYRRRSTHLAVAAVDTAIVTVLAGQHTGWRTVISVVPATSTGDRLPAGTGWQYSAAGIHPAALALGCSPDGPVP